MSAAPVDLSWAIVATGFKPRSRPISETAVAIVQVTVIVAWPVLAMFAAE
jgi:uncharacterized membrane protein SpoIIM required for sporulation